MERVQLTRNLYLDEYIPKEMYLKYCKTPWVLIGLIDRQLVRADQMLRDRFGAETINNWWEDGERQWSGLRLPESPDYSLTSQHTYGRASDKLFKLATAEEVRQYIRQNWKELGITCIEDNVTWVHSDTRYLMDTTKLLIV